MIGCRTAVAARTTSASPRTFCRSPKGTAFPPSLSASSRARARLRFKMRISALGCRLFAAMRAIFPVPIKATIRFSTPTAASRNRTAAWLADASAGVTPAILRTWGAIWEARRNKSAKGPRGDVPAGRSTGAFRTWAVTCSSPSARESNPLATRMRCAAASRSSRTYRVGPSFDTPRTLRTASAER